ncbi:MAG TPA: hypothetical protein VF880_05460, partial [Actinomycetes bacterium]
PMSTSRPRASGRAGWALAALTLAALVLLAAPAAAASYVDAAAAGLRADHVYVDPGATAIVSEQDAAKLRDSVERAGTPIFIAVLPATARQEAGDNTVLLAKDIAGKVALPGAYMVVAGDQWAAGRIGRTLPAGRAQALGEAAFDAHRDAAPAALQQWVDGVATAAREGGQAQPGGQPDTVGGGDTGGGRGGFGGTIAGVAVAVLLLVGGGALLFGATRRRRERERELAEVKTVAQEDLVALGEDIRALDIDTSMPGADPEAIRHHAEAVDAYQRAARILDRATRPEDLAGMSAALEAGRFSMASARAILEGRPPPERRPPCFFDPRHGPSVEDVEWTPAGGVPRTVPVCAADAQRIRDGVDPQSRHVLTGAGERVPYYNAPGYYAPWFGGYFGGFGGMGGLFTGFLLGSALGGWGGYPVYVGGDGGDGGNGGDGGDGGDGGGGDGGGGDWGGGDFGGGDFGGGDFGGGGE